MTTRAKAKPQNDGEWFGHIQYVADYSGLPVKTVEREARLGNIRTKEDDF